MIASPSSSSLRLPQDRRTRTARSRRVSQRALPTLIVTFALTLALSSVAAAQPAEPADQPATPTAYRESIQRLDPMDTTGLDHLVDQLLRNYYESTFTDSYTWDQVISIRYDGTLHLPQGKFRFTAFKKKPDYCKLVLYTAGGGRLVMAYDGTDAWKLNTAPGSQLSRAAPTAVAMPELEALNFIRDATTGSHLLYPGIEGKQIEFLGVTTANDQRVYELKITLPDGQQICSLLDTVTYAELQQVTINNLTGDVEVTDHQDFRIIDGVRVPFTSTLSTVDGQQIHQIRLDSVQINSGVMPWMFSRPSGASLGTRPGAREMPQVEGEASSFDQPTTDLPPSARPFAPAPSADIWAPSVFIDPIPVSPND